MPGRVPRAAYMRDPMAFAYSASIDGTVVGSVGTVSLSLTDLDNGIDVGFASDMLNTQGLGQYMPLVKS